MINKLSGAGIEVYTGNSGEVRLHIPEPVSPGARPLLDELRQRKAEVIQYLRWDEAGAINLFKRVLDRLRGQYDTGALSWAKSNRPELHGAVMRAQEAYESACKQGDMIKCRQAVNDFERAVIKLMETYREEVNHGKPSAV